MNEYDMGMVIDSMQRYYDGESDGDDHWGGGRNFIPIPKRNHCSFCHKGGLHWCWVYAVDGWRLVNKKGKVHDCRKKARDKRDKKQIAEILKTL